MSDFINHRLKGVQLLLLLSTYFCKAASSVLLRRSDSGPYHQDPTTSQPQRVAISFDSRTQKIKELKKVRFF